MIRAQLTLLYPFYTQLCMFAENSPKLFTMWSTWVSKQGDLLLCLIGRRTRRNVSMLACFTGKVEIPPIVSCENEAAFNHVKKILLNKLRTLHFLTVSNLSLYSLLQACLWSLSVFPFVLIFFFFLIYYYGNMAVSSISAKMHSNAMYAIFFKKKGTRE